MGGACSAAFRSSSRSIRRSSRSATRCCRATATRFARRCWSSFRIRAAGRSPSRPARRRPASRRTCRGEHVSVYVPTTPNPTGGYFLMLPRAQVRELDMTVDEALKYIISMGVVAAARTRTARGDIAARRYPLHCRSAPRRPKSEIDAVGGARPAPPARPAVAIRPTSPENDLKRTDYCGRIDRRYLGQIRIGHGLGASAPRPRRRDLHRPARPRRPGADRLRSRSRGDVRDRREAAQRVRASRSPGACVRVRRARSIRISSAAKSRCSPHDDRNSQRCR